MKDNLLLLMVGSVAAGLSWVFWHFTGENGALVIMTVAVVSLLIDNRRLRKILRENGLTQKTTKPESS